MKLFVEASVLTGSHKSGVSHTLLFILREWQREAHLKDSYEVILLVPFDRKKILRELDLGFKIRSLPLPDKILRALRKFNLLPPMDMFIGRGVYLFPNYWNWPLLRSQSLTYMYDLSFIVFPEQVEPRNQRFLSRNVPTWMLRTNKILTISHYIKDEILNMYSIPPDKVEVIYNGVDRSFYKPQPAQVVREVKQKYDVSDQYLLFVGNIEPRKNISRLVKAYSLLPPNIQQKYQLVIVGGGGWNNDRILRDIERAKDNGINLNKIKQFVVDDDLPALYAGATALVHPALYEGFGMTPLEAMAAGVPVIVGKNTSIPEVVGDAGLYVNAEDERDISDKIKVLLENGDLRNELARKGLSRSKSFSWSNTVQKLEQCVGEVGGEDG